MSVFDPNGNQPASVDNALEALVGDDKKFKSVEDLAKGKLESDNYIEQLKGQLAELQAKANEAKTLEDVLAAIQPKTTPTPDPVAEAHQPAKPAMTDEDLSKKVREMLEEKDRQAAITRNVTEVAERLIAVKGSEQAANEYVRQRAAELGVSVEWLQDVAARSPKAFYETVRVEAPTPPASPTHGDVNTQALAKHSPGIKPNTYKWYQEIRKTNPTAYTKMALQMHADAKALGEKFYE